MDNLKTKRAAMEQILTPGEADVNDPAGLASSHTRDTLSAASRNIQLLDILPAMNQEIVGTGARD
ncbi:MAG: hypothetical protein KDA91_18805 [Planctomycetaceae bacterium]|nr:hypothetical protein [Planctomycetaceae bacterium]